MCEVRYGISHYTNTLLKRNTAGDGTQKTCNVESQAAIYGGDQQESSIWDVNDVHN